MNIKNMACLCLAVSFLTACASNPDKMTAVDVSPFQYQNYDCDQIGVESSRIQKKINTLYSQLKKEANADAVQMGVGLVLFWPALFLLEGGDGPEAVEYRQLKGEYEALRKISIQKKCGFEFQDLDAMLKKKAEENGRKKVKKTTNFN
jgi:hypothetical protein